MEEAFFAVINYLDALFNYVLEAPPLDGYWVLFRSGGWLIVFFLLLKMFWDVYMLCRICSNMAYWKWVYLAVDVPKGNEQTPKAVEQIFAHLAGAHKNPDIEEQYLGGYMQPWFSFEIVSIEGYTQFVVSTIDKYRELVEEAVYAQYPDAEITEIEDYTKNLPDRFPSKEYTLWGTEYILANFKEQAYPIRTYSEFEHPTAENVYKDPLAALLETFSRLGPGEFAGMQILIKPIDDEWNSWKKEGLKLVEKLIGAPLKQKQTWLSKLGALPGKALDEVVGGITGAEVGPAEAEKKDEPPSKMLFLSPGTKTVVEKVENKISKICYATKIRFVYVAKHKAYNKNRIAYGTTGAMKQFNTFNCNAIKPEMHKIGTHVHYFFKQQRLNWRRTRLLQAYKGRSRWRGHDEYLMSIEELASIWHFPMLTVKAPLISKAEARRAQPPNALPMENVDPSFDPVARKGLPPTNLPT